MPRACPKALLGQEPPSACFVLDEAALVENAAILRKAQEDSGAKILLALKGFAAFAVFPLLSRNGQGPLWGTCASSVDEARLGREEFGGEVHAFAAAWSRDEMRELLQYANHIVFNSFAQWREFRPMIEAHNALAKSEIQCGLRLNPEHSEGAAAIYNPCAPGSRLGIRARDFYRPGNSMDGISGLHFHTLCEQGADALARTLLAVEEKFGPSLPGRQWLNFGGGHHITREGYDLELLTGCVRDWRRKYKAQIYLEPGEAVALDAGWFTATVLDVVEADMPVAILDVSAACHMPDVLEMPYTPRVFYEWEGVPTQAGEAGQNAHVARLAGKSCLAGDIIGEYSFAGPLRRGQRLVFADMAIYSMVKTTTFNGLRLPSIGIYGAGGDFRLLKTFGYEDFKGRLS